MTLKPVEPTLHLVIDIKSTKAVISKTSFSVAKHAIQANYWISYLSAQAASQKLSGSAEASWKKKPLRDLVFEQNQGECFVNLFLCLKLPFFFF